MSGEYKNGLPHGLCFMFFKYNGELGPAASRNKPSSDPYLDGSYYSFKGVGTFVDGVLTDGPAFFVDGDGDS